MMNRVDSDNVSGQNFNICHLRQIWDKYWNKKTAPRKSRCYWGASMYSESLRPPICYGQSVLVKESPTAVIYIIQTKERIVSNDTNTKESGVSSNWHPYYTVHFFICQRFFWKFLKFFHRKRQPDKNQIALFKSLAFIHHITLTSIACM